MTKITNQKSQGYEVWRCRNIAAEINSLVAKNIRFQFVIVENECEVDEFKPKYFDRNEDSL